MSEKKLFMKYVSQNVLGMLGISVYILADTFFISLAEGADGITALNLVLPVYSLIFAIGAMIGVGSAIRFKILRARRDKEAELYFSNALLWALIIGSVFILTGIFMPEQVVALLGGDDRIVAVGREYTAIFISNLNMNPTGETVFGPEAGTKSVLWGCMLLNEIILYKLSSGFR